MLSSRIMTFAFWLLTVAISMPAAGSGPPDPQALITESVIADVRNILSHDIVPLALRAANDKRANLRASDVGELDDQWREQQGQALQPLVSSALSSPLSAYLTRIQAGSVGLFTEIFVVGRQGLNVGQSAVTSDFWQGDESKFTRTYDVGPGAVFIDGAEWHAPTRTWRSQLNLTVDDPRGGRPLGAATFEINLTELSRRMETRP
ncbi:MAG: hypothetical protein AAGF45_08670 [Pseudomonadota bacterium]